MVSFNRFQRLALLTTATTYLLIGVGGLVRASGAGLGCPDWPQCFGLWIPPLSVEDLPKQFSPDQFNVFKTWTEYINRLLGVLTGFLIFGTLILAVLDHRRTPRVLWPTVAAFISVGINGWLGGMVVRSQLAPLVLTGHLIFALLVVSLLLYATVSAFYLDGPQAGEFEPERTRLGWITVAAALLVLIQVGLGAFLRGEAQELAKQGVPRADWLGHIRWVDIAHQNFAVVVAMGVLVACAFAWREEESALRNVASAGVILLGLQVLAGLALSAWAFPPVFQALHLWGSTLLLGALSAQAMFVWRIVPKVGT